MTDHLRVKIIENNEGQILFECSLEDLDCAYQKAQEFEAMGLDISLQTPTISQSLTLALGLRHDEAQGYEQSVLTEIEDHEGSCCHELGVNKNK